MKEVTLHGVLSTWNLDLLKRGKVPMKYLSNFKRQYELKSVEAKEWVKFGKTYPMLSFEVEIAEDKINELFNKLPENKVISYETTNPILKNIIALKDSLMFIPATPNNNGNRIKKSPRNKGTINPLYFQNIYVNIIGI